MSYKDTFNLDNGMVAWPKDADTKPQEITPVSRETKEQPQDNWDCATDSDNPPSMYVTGFDPGNDEKTVIKRYTNKPYSSGFWNWDSSETQKHEEIVSESISETFRLATVKKEGGVYAKDPIHNDSQYLSAHTPDHQLDADSWLIRETANTAQKLKTTLPLSEKSLTDTANQIEEIKALRKEGDAKTGLKTRRIGVFVAPARMIEAGHLDKLKRFLDIVCVCDFDFDFIKNGRSVYIRHDVLPEIKEGFEATRLCISMVGGDIKINDSLTGDTYLTITNWRG